MHVYLQLSAHDHRVSRSARGSGGCACTGCVVRRPSSVVAVAVLQDCVTHLSRHRLNASERSPDDAYAMVLQVVAITRTKERSGRKYKRMNCLAFSIWIFFFFSVFFCPLTCACGVGVRSQGKTLCPAGMWPPSVSREIRGRVHSIGGRVEASM